MQLQAVRVPIPGHKIERINCLLCTYIMGIDKPETNFSGFSAHLILVCINGCKSFALPLSYTVPQCSVGGPTWHRLSWLCRRIQIMISFNPNNPQNLRKGLFIALNRAWLMFTIGCSQDI